MTGILPERIRRRGTNVRFLSVVGRELRELYRNDIQALLETPKLSEGIDWSFVRRIFRNYCDGVPDANQYLGNLVMAIGLELWYRSTIHNDGGQNGK